MERARLATDAPHVVWLTVPSECSVTTSCTSTCSTYKMRCSVQVEFVCCVSQMPGSCLACCRKDPKLKAVQEKSWEQTEIAEAQYQESLANGDFDATAVESGEDESLFAGEDAEDKPLP